MGAASSILIGTGVLSTISNISSTKIQQEGILSQGAIEESIARSEARNARIKSAEAIKRGEEDVAILRERKEQLTGTQKLKLAAQGIDPTSGSGAAIIAESRMFGDLDIIERKNNARLEAMGFESQALTSEGRANFIKLSTKTQAKQTALTGITNIMRDFMSIGVRTAEMKASTTPADDVTKVGFAK